MGQATAKTNGEPCGVVAVFASAGERLSEAYDETGEAGAG
jgi:hypothetical protein